MISKRPRRRLFQIEQLEPRCLLAHTGVVFDFGPPRSEVEPGATEVSAKTMYTPDLGYGWLTREIKDADRRTADPLRRDFVYGAGSHQFLVDVENGLYQVRAIMGDAADAHDQMAVFAEGVLQASGLTSQRGVFLEVVFEVEVRDNLFNFVVADRGGSDPHVVLNGLAIHRLSTTPAFDPIDNQMVAEDSGDAYVTITGVRPGSAVASSDSVVLTAVSDQPSIVPHPTISGDGDTRTLRFFPAANAYGSADVTVTATDAGGASFQQTFTVQVTPVNDSPGFDPIANQAVSQGAGQTNVTITGVTAGPSNESGQLVAFAVASSNPAIIPDPTISGSGDLRTLSFTPAAGAAGQVTITVAAQDNGGVDNGGIDSFQRTFTIDVIPRSQPPAFDPIADQSVAEDSGARSVTITGVTSGAGDVVLTAVSNQPEIVPNPVISGSGDTRTLTFTPAANANGAAAITVTATRSDGASSQQSFTIYVSPVNDAPAFDPIANRSVADDSGQNDIPITGVSAGPADEAGQSVALTAVSSNPAIIPFPVVVGSGASRTLSFTPVPETSGTVTITVTALDAGGTANGGVDLFQRTFTVNVVHELDDEGVPDYERDYIITHHDKIPNFARHPTITVTQSGRWSEIPALVAAGQDDIVLIAVDADVLFDVQNANIKTLGVAGTLRFAADQNTHLTLANFLVFKAGTLEIGTQAAPIRDDVTARITFADRALDLALDPSQYGNGLIAFGKVNMVGRALDETYARLAQDPRAGDAVLHLSQVPAGWRVGDELVLPNTALADFGGAEKVTIAALASGAITLTAPLTKDHLGARDGDLVTVATGATGERLFPHVGNLTRNVILQSANPAGMRGHVMIGERAVMDARYARFDQLGRTTMADVDSTTFDTEGNVTHIGTNQIGRYSLHLHHLAGPRTPLAADASVDRPGLPTPQYRLVGASITSALKWGLAIHDTHYGLVKENVVYDVQGAAIITEDGSESYNVFESNFVAQVPGNGSGDRYDPQGRRGAGFWLRGNRNYFYDNTVASAGEGYGFYIQNDSGNSQQANLIVHVPLFPGADTHEPGEYEERKINSLELPAFVGNESYNNSHFGVALWSVQSLPIDQTPLFEDTTVWHVKDAAVFLDYSAGIFDGLSIRGDVNMPGTGVRGHNPNSLTASPFIVREFNFQLLNHVYTEDDRPHRASTPFIFEDGFARNFRGFLFTSESQGVAARRYTLRDIDFEPVTGRELVTIETRIDERWRNPGTWFFDSIDNPIQILVFNYDGVIGDNFRVYFNEQSPDYVIDIASYGVEAPRNNAQFFEGIASPVWIPELRFLTPTPGLTNAESFARHRAAVLNEVAPTTDTTSHPEIIGITASLLGQEPPSFADTPTPFFWFQENRTTDLPSDFTILYKDFAVQGADAIHFRIDNGPPIIETDNDGVLQISDVPAGAHSVSAFLADSAGNEWANRVRFTIDVTESAPAVANFAGATQTATATQVLPVAEEEESQESQDQPTQLDERPHVAVTEFESAPMAGAGESDKSPFTSELIDALFADDDKLADVL